MPTQFPRFSHFVYLPLALLVSYSLAVSGSAQDVPASKVDAPAAKKTRVPPAAPLAAKKPEALATPASDKPAEPPAPPVVWYGQVSGNFLPFFDEKGNPQTVQVSVLNQESQVIGQATSVSFTANDMQFFYMLTDAKAVPAALLVGLKSPGDHRYSFTQTNTSNNDASVASYTQVIVGDFCLADKPLPGGQCTTGLVNVDTTGAVRPLDPSVSKIKAYVQAADGASKDATLYSIGLDNATISFTAAAGYQAAWLVLEGPAGSHKFAYVPAPPVQVNDMIFTSDDIEKICNGGSDKPDCVNTVAGDLAPLKPIASDANATFVAVQDHLLVARVRAPMGLEPTAILVTNTHDNPHSSVIVRRTLKPGQNVNLLQVDMSIMDQSTADRNFGNRIGKRYLAVTLDVKNPTAQKLQFKKSAVYFDVDYVEAKENTSNEIYHTFESAISLGLIPPSPYVGEFVKAKSGRVFRFGLEQNAKQSPINYLSALGSFDETTERLGQEFDTVQLLSSIMNSIATGGIAGTGQFKNASALLSGVFLPGLKGIVLNDSRINRRRANLVAQTLQEIIEIPARSSATTIVLLPRKGILAFSNAEVPVIIDRVRDVHLETQVVTPVTATAVAKGTCKVGYTKDQARDALGEPAGVTTNADGSSTFTYPKGPVTSASFNAAGELVSCQQRSVSDQLAQAGTQPEMTETLTRLGLAGKKIGLADGSTVFTDIPGVQQAFHFDAKENKTTDYTFLFPQIKAFETKTKSDLEAFLQKPTTALSTARADEIQKYINAKPKNDLKYPSPDIQNGAVVVTLKDAAGNIQSITFTGDKPASVN